MTGWPCKVSVILVRCNETWIFFDRFSKNTQVPNFMKNRPVGAELFHEGWRAGGQSR
jgi:hypothetical protein